MLMVVFPRPRIPQKVGKKKIRIMNQQMDPAAREIFEKKRLRYGYFRELLDAQEREVFTRVQLGKPLDIGGAYHAIPDVARLLTGYSPAEKSRAIDSEYTRWVEAYKERFLGSKPDSLNPRIVGTEGQERGGLRVGTYHMLRNLLAGTLSHESSARRIATLQDSPAPADEDNDRVMRGMERFLQLTLVPALPGADEWPNTQMFAKRRENDVHVPHRVWRLRQEQLAQERALRHGVVQFAPVELQILPTVVNMDRFKDLSDGEMLELVEKLRIHIHDSIPGEVKDNTKTYDLVNQWLSCVFCRAPCWSRSR